VKPFGDWRGKSKTLLSFDLDQDILIYPDVDQNVHIGLGELRNRDQGVWVGFTPFEIAPPPYIDFA
jgi:hypothetical protein